MVNEKNQNIPNWDNEKVVFFFGAGASKSEGGIITNQLLEESFKRFSKDERVIMVKEYLKDIYHNECNDSNIPTFEEVLGPIDIALQKQENMSANWNVEKLGFLRDNLIYCICKILNEKLQSPNGHHDDFINQLLVKHPDRLNKCSFVSLNYDILLDNALMKSRNRRSLNIDIDYGIKFRNETHTRFRQQNVNIRHIQS